MVRFYRIVDFLFDDKTQQQTKAYRPRIEHCLQFTPFDTETVRYNDNSKKEMRCALFGQHTELTQRKVGNRFLNFQIVFQPGVLSSVFKLSMAELTNEYIDASLFLGNEVYSINDKLAECKSYNAMIFVIETYLQQWDFNAKDIHPVSKTISSFFAYDSLQNIDRYASQANLSYRQFDRNFQSLTGIAPKDFRMLVKLDYAYLLKNRTPVSDWLSIALQAGFYDYQHLSKSYQQYLGYTPTQFYAIEQTAPERSFGFYEQ